MRILFFGIYLIGQECLTRLCAAGFPPIAVVTKPDDENNQPVAVTAGALGLDLLQPENPKDAGFVQAVGKLAPDLCLVAGYHKIIPSSVLSIPNLGTFNLHGSLLPAYRGPCTWKWAIMNGEKHTGVTVHYMTPKLDCGDIVAQSVLPIREDDTGGALFARMSAVGADLLLEVVEDLGRGRIGRTPQDESKATYFGYPTEEDCRIRWSQPVVSIHNQVRGLSPAPGAWTLWRGERYRILKAQVAKGQNTNQPPGQVLRVSKSTLFIATGQGVLEVMAATHDNRDQLKIPGTASDFLVAVGDVLGE